MPDVHRANILVVDDEEFNREIITDSLEDENYQVTTAENGQVAWDILQTPGAQFDVIVLDRMMPVMDGMELLAHIKAHPVHQLTPIIMQTAKADPEDIAEGLQAGAYYYLTKPYEHITLQAIINTALRDHEKYNRLVGDISNAKHCLQLLNNGEFRFRSIQEAHSLSSMLSHVYVEPGKIAIGLAELFINAVEHGNLGISYKEKSNFLENDSWEEEVERRLLSPEYNAKFATVQVQRSDDTITFTVTDQGAGFDFSSFVTPNPSRVFDNHGRGIMMAKALSFDHVEYQGKGNIVTATIAVRPTPQ